MSKFPLADAMYDYIQSLDDLSAPLEIIEEKLRKVAEIRDKRSYNGGHCVTIDSNNPIALLF